MRRGRSFTEFQGQAVMSIYQLSFIYYFNLCILSFFPSWQIFQWINQHWPRKNAFNPNDNDSTPVEVLVRHQLRGKPLPVSVFTKSFGMMWHRHQAWNLLYSMLQQSWKGVILVSPCPSVHLWTESCPLCIFNNTHRIHFIFAHLIKELQKVCRV